MRQTLVFTAVLYAAMVSPVSAQNQPMGFFISSTGSGMGGNLGGLAGADKHCQALAAAAGSSLTKSGRRWREMRSKSAVSRFRVRASISASA